MDQSPWDPLPVRRQIARARVGRGGPGVGKRSNRQVPASVRAATDTASRLLGWQLYLARDGLA